MRPSALYVDLGVSLAYISLGASEAAEQDKPLRGKPDAAVEGAHLSPEGLEVHPLRQGGLFSFHFSTHTQLKARMSR